jgi:hypothetical protein
MDPRDERRIIRELKFGSISTSAVEAAQFCARDMDLDHSPSPHASRIMP